MSNNCLFDWVLSELDAEPQHPFQMWKGEGYCCFCNDECNPVSQNCGLCIRNGEAMKVYFNSTP